MNVKEALAVILVEGNRPGADALKTSIELLTLSFCYYFDNR